MLDPAAPNPSVRLRAKQFAVGMVLLALGLASALRLAGYSWETSALGGGWVLSIPLAITVGLAFTAPAAAEYAEAKMTDPNGKVQELRKRERIELQAMVDSAVARIAIPDYGAQIRAVQGQINARLTKELASLPIPTVPTAAEIVASIKFPEFPKLPDFTTMEERLDEAAEAIDSSAKAYEWVKSQVSDEHLRAVFLATYNDIKAAEHAREGKAPAGAKAEQEQAIGARLVNDPEEARIYKTAMTWLDTMEKNPRVTGISVPTIKKWRGQIKDTFASGDPVTGLLGEFGIKEGAWGGLLGGGAPSVNVQAKGGGRAPGMP